MAVSFQDILNKINTGAQIAAALEPSLQLFSTDHATATQQIIQIAGAGVAALSSDIQVQQEAASAAQLAASFVPLVFSFMSLFHKAKPATVVAIPQPSTIPTQTNSSV